MDKVLLEQLLKSGMTIKAISDEVGISETPVRYWIKKYGLSANFRRKEWTDDDLISAIKVSSTKSDVLRKLGLKVIPGNYDTINRHIKRLGINTSHFSGKGCGRGGFIRIPIDKILVRDSSYPRSHLKKRLLEDSLLEERCEICGIENEWNGKPIVLILDHINGVNNDNRIDNLRFLCPNCNSQQKTFCRGRKGV